MLYGYDVIFRTISFDIALIPMLFKGIEREVISPRTRFSDPSQDFECTHPIVLNPHSSFL